MAFGVIVMVAVLGLIAGAIVLAVRGGRSGLDLGPRTLVRAYLYVASLAGVVVLVAGLSGVLNAGLAATLGDGFVYGDDVRAQPVPACPPVTEPNVKCPPAQTQPDLEQQRARELARRRGEDLIRGLTFSVFGALFWGAHWAARRGLAENEASPGLRRGYLMLGTVVFGLATIVLLPTGTYQALSYVLLPAGPGTFRPGVGDALAGGLATLPAWLTYLWLVVQDLRRTPPAGA
jgi:hypothetical protein